jgi:hypothetical protein
MSETPKKGVDVYFSLHHADPRTFDHQGSYETAYQGYTRIKRTISKESVFLKAIEDLALYPIEFPICGGLCFIHPHITHVGIGLDPTGEGHLMHSFEIPIPLYCGSGLRSVIQRGTA